MNLQAGARPLLQGYYRPGVSFGGKRRGIDEGLLAFGVEQGIGCGEPEFGRSGQKTFRGGKSVSSQW